MALRLEKESVELLHAARELLDEARRLSERDWIDYPDQSAKELNPHIERRAELAIADLEFAVHP